MKYYRYLYTSDSIKKIEKYKLKLNTHNGFTSMYVILLSDNNDMLEIMNSIYLKLKYYRKHPKIVIGITKTYDEALDIVINIINESIKKTGSPNVKEYLKLRAKTRDFTI